MDWRMDWVRWVSGLEAALSRGGHPAAGMGLAIRARVAASQCENGGVDAPAGVPRRLPRRPSGKKATHEHFSPDLGPDPSR